ncbi:BRCT domain-containing protein [Bacillus sp. JJ722]|uniref:BRCT domain-containing protein n=1 Tax=Bacillus sp. JJ722 TaxID=3122973 RepID=UPI002FFDB6C7
MVVEDIHQIQGKTFVITGVLSKTRREIASEITKHGGIMAGSVTAKTDYLVIGQRFGNTKVSAAFRLGTFTITEEELREMFLGKTLV